jgi:hypothetical protein
MGDADYTDQTNYVQVEDMILADPDGQDNFDEYTTTVVVTDGKLTLQPTAQSVNAKVCFINISRLSITQIEQERGLIPKQFSLEQSYPNPFNPKTTITFSIPTVSHVRLNIYNINGQEVVALVNEVKIPGVYSISFDGSGLASGIYFYKLVQDLK